MHKTISKLFTYSDVLRYEEHFRKEKKTKKKKQNKNKNRNRNCGSRCKTVYKDIVVIDRDGEDV